MLRSRLLVGLLLGLSVAASRAQTPTPNEPALSARDYLDIEQLVYKYSWALDSGENNGFAYADLYAPEATFTGTNQGPNGRTYQGRESLAALARGPHRGPLNISHYVANLIVTPTADGAAGRVYVGIFDTGGPGKPPDVGHGGFYDDVYVRTPDGWRFKKRTFYEGKWGEPNVPLPPPVPGVRALKEGKAGPAPKGPRLSDQDHVAIQQLIARYPYALDMNSNSGASYAGLYTPDGSFACVAPNAGAAAQRSPAGCVADASKLTTERPRAKGSAALAKMVASEEPYGPAYVRHFIFNHVIDAVAGGGAKGKSYLAVIDITPGQQGSGHSIFLMGRYDDEYVKTAQGWRIKNRVFSATASRRSAAPATK